MITAVLATIDELIQKNALAIMRCQRRCQELIRVEKRWEINQRPELCAKAGAKFKMNQAAEKLLEDLQSHLTETREAIQALEE